MEFYQAEDFLGKMITLIRECNKLILDVYHSDFSVEEKSDKSPLTIADKVCNNHICEYLKSNFNGISIISEEIKNKPYSDRKNNQWCWLIDPIDGTKEFIKRNGEFTVNIGLCKNGVPVFGIVSIPVTGEIYYGTNKQGSFKLNNNECTRIQTKKANGERMIIVASSSHMNDNTKEYISQFDNPTLVSVGSSIKLLLVAEGKANLYPRIAPTCEWDTCAAHAVVKYAGGTVVNFETGEELKYNKENLLNPFFIVSPM